MSDSEGSIRKRGNGYDLVMYIGRDPQTGKPRQKWFRFRTLRETEAAQAQLNVQLQGGDSSPIPG